jgi:hypothetical protein
MCASGATLFQKMVPSERLASASDILTPLKWTIACDDCAGQADLEVISLGAAGLTPVPVVLPILWFFATANLGDSCLEL